MNMTSHLIKCIKPGKNVSLWFMLYWLRKEDSNTNQWSLPWEEDINPLVHCDLWQWTPSVNLTLSEKWNVYLHFKCKFARFLFLGIQIQYYGMVSFSKTISISLFMNIKIQEINQCVQFVNFSWILFMNTLLTRST